MSTQPYTASNMQDHFDRLVSRSIDFIEFLTKESRLAKTNLTKCGGSIFSTGWTFRNGFLERSAAKTSLPVGQTLYRALLQAALSPFGGNLPTKADALNAVETLLYCATPIFASVLAWMLLVFCFSLALVPSDAKRSLWSRIRSCRKPTIILALVQLGITSMLPHPTVGYEVKLKGAQEIREVKTLNMLAFQSWLATLAILVTMFLVLVIIISVSDWVEDVRVKRELSRRVNVRQRRKT